MNSYTTADSPKKQFPTGVVGARFPFALGVQCVEMTLEPGGVVPTHPKEGNALFYVISGTVFAIIGDEEQEVTAGTLVESPADKVHGIQNRSNIEAKVLVIKPENN